MQAGELLSIQNPGTSRRSLLFVLFRRQCCFSAKPNPAVLVDIDHLNQNFVAFVYNVGNLANAPVFELRDMYQALCIGQNFSKRAEVSHSHYFCHIEFADFRLRGDVPDLLNCFVTRFGIRAHYNDSATVVNVDFRSRFGDNRSDHFASRTDNVSDLIGIYLNSLDSGRIPRELGPGFRNGFLHFSKYMKPPGPGLIESSFQYFPVDSGYFYVHLEGGDSLVGSSDFEIHVPKMVLVSKDVGKDYELIAFFDQPHGYACHRIRNRHSRVQKGQGSTTYSSHRTRSV